MGGAAGVILDRDGTLVDFVRDAELGSVVSAFHPDQLRLLPGVVEGLTALQGAGFVLAMATNQPGAAKGEVPASAIARTNEALVTLLAGHGIRLAATRACLHHPEGGPGGDASLIGPCACRKPGPGMLVELVAELGLDARVSWMVGDTAADLGAARAAGLRAALLYPVGERCELCPLRGHVSPAPGLSPDVGARRFDEVAAAILRADR